MTRDPYIPLASANAAWQASSYSGGQGNCVEVARNVPRLVPVRDSKRADGPVLRFSPSAWRAFLGHVG